MTDINAESNGPVGAGTGAGAVGYTQSGGAYLIQNKPKDSHLDDGAEGYTDVDEADAGLQRGARGSCRTRSPIPAGLTRLWLRSLILLQAQKPVVAHSSQPQACNAQPDEICMNLHPQCHDAARQAKSALLKAGQNLHGQVTAETSAVN